LQLFCQLDGHSQLVPHTLQPGDIDDERCSLVLPSNGHTHGPDCGHETVPHDDHVDYLVSAWRVTRRISGRQLTGYWL